MSKDLISDGGMDPRNAEDMEAYLSARADKKDAERWRAFRSRYKFRFLHVNDFKAAFDEEADRIIDAVLDAEGPL